MTSKSCAVIYYDNQAQQYIAVGSSEEDAIQKIPIQHQKFKRFVYHDFHNINPLDAVKLDKHGRRGDWITTVSGIPFYCFDPKIGDISLSDICHACGYECRWGNMSKQFYSVAQHSVYVGLAAEEYALETTGSKDLGWLAKLVGYLHDAHEAYSGDHPTPIKRHIPILQCVEDLLDTAIFEKIGVSKNNYLSVLEFVKKADRSVLVMEKYALVKQTEWHSWDCLEPPWKPEGWLKPMGPDESGQFMLNALKDIGLKNV